MGLEDHPSFSGRPALRSIDTRIISQRSDASAALLCDAVEMLALTDDGLQEASGMALYANGTRRVPVQEAMALCRGHLLASPADVGLKRAVALFESLLTLGIFAAPVLAAGDG